MVTTNLSGGFGNNLFQIANIIAISEKLNTSFKINGHVNRGVAGNYNGHIFEFDSIFESLECFIDPHIKVSHSYNHKDMNPKDDFTFMEVPAKDDTVYNGYFQSDKYFNNVDISEYFRIKQTLINSVTEKYELNKYDKTTSLHFRHGV